MKKLISMALSLVMAITMFTGCNGQNDVYRLIKVNSFEGTVTIQREDKMDAFEGLQLVSEDTVEVGTASLLELLADSDKHIVAEENTAFKLHSAGTETSGNITIDLLYGSSLITIDNKLPDGSSFQVNTPNVSLSVRGTTFEVSYDPKTETTTVEVTEGVVAVVSKNGTEELTAGATTSITNDGINGDGETEENGEGSTKPLTFKYSDKTSFNIRYKGSLEKYSGIKAKELVGWQAVLTNEGDRFNNAFPPTIEIYYWILTKDQLDQDKAEKQSSGYIESSYTLENGDGQMIDCIKCNFHDKNFAMAIGQNNVEFAYQYYKKVADNMYLSIMVCDLDGGKALENTDIYTYLPLTEEKYYVYSVTPNPEEIDNNIEVEFDIPALSDNARVVPLEITLEDFEANYVEAIIELTPENSKEYFQVIQKNNGEYNFALKPGYTPYKDGINVKTSNGEASQTAGGSRYIFNLGDNPNNLATEWTASGTIAKHTITNDMWCKVGDKGLVIIKSPDGSAFVIER